MAREIGTSHTVPDAPMQLRPFTAIGDAEPTEVAVIGVPLRIRFLPDGRAVATVRRWALRRLLRKLGRVVARSL